MRRFGLIPLLLLSIGLVGCVTGTRSIAIPEPDQTISRVRSGEIAIGVVEDARVFEQKPAEPSTPSVRGELAETSREKLSTLIGRQRNAYGKAMGDVDLPDGRTVQDELRGLLARGLTGRGYTIPSPGANSRGTTRLDATINEFWAWFTPGMWMISFEARLDTRLVFDTPSGRKLVEVKGYGRNRGQVASDANWALAYQRAYNDYLVNLAAALDEAGL